MVDFTVDEVNFEQEGWAAYKRFIERVRNLVAVGYSHNSPVTPIEVNPPTQFFDVQLATNNYRITVRFRRDNLYLVGYRMHNSEQWLELLYDHSDGHNQNPGRGDPPRGFNPLHRIPDAEWLTFGDSYDQLVAAARRRAPDGTPPALTDFSFGREEFIGAITNLATSTDSRTRAKYVMVLAIMISESIRFKEITAYFDSAAGRGSARIPDWISRYIRGWGALSASILHTDWVDEDGNLFRLPTIPSNFPGIETVAQALMIIGIMKGYDWPRLRERRAADDNGEQYQGRPLVELFSVTIDNVHGNENIIVHVYGTIKVSDGLGYEYMYNRETNSSEYIRMKDTILLNGPPRCLSAYDNFTIDVALMMSREALSEDDEISKGQIVREVTYLHATDYDKLLTQQVQGRFGSATISYAILRDAVMAMVEVTLITNNRQPANVYGLLSSHNGALNSECVLFHKANNKFVNVENETLIPLSRSVVAAPLCSNFIVRADLKGSNIYSSDDEIAKGIATFTPGLYGTHEETVYGQNNYQIRVKVTWSWYV